MGVTRSNFVCDEFGSSPTLSRTTSLFLFVPVALGMKCTCLGILSGLTRHVVRAIADASLVAKFLDNPVPVSFMDSSRTNLPGSCELLKWFPGCVTPSGRDVVGVGFAGADSVDFLLFPSSSCSAVQPGSCSASGSVGGGLRVFPGLGSPGNRDAPVDGIFGAGRR